MNIASFRFPSLSLNARAAFACLLLALTSPSLDAQRRHTARPAPALQRVRADDGHALAVWHMSPAGSRRGVILLLHGRTWSSLPNFDLRWSEPQTRGGPPRRHSVSLFEALTARGYAVYALDQRGYGRTARDSSQYLTPARAARDAELVLRWMHEREGGAARPALMGYSRGAMTAMLAAQGAPDAMSAVMLYGFPSDVTTLAAARPDTSPEREQLERRRTTAADAESDFITPASTGAGVKEAYVRAALMADPVRADWRREREFAALDPAALRVPVLVINGERDPYAARANLAALVSRIAGVDRSWVVLARADHVAHLQRQREFVDAIVSFMATPHASPPRR